MNIEALLFESLQLFALGMGSVFTILCLLIIIITVVSKLVPEPAQPTVSIAPEPATTIDPKHVAAIQSAIHQYRQKRGL
ncbi:MAG: sodium pump decarboxylase gamma subunit [Gammaproteobacteria bacterium]|jgi:sodium pump decarboxylase gamma subunit